MIFHLLLIHHYGTKYLKSEVFPIHIIIYRNETTSHHLNFLLLRSREELYAKPYSPKHITLAIAVGSNESIQIANIQLQHFDV